jgi:hypothetical protein
MNKQRKRETLTTEEMAHLNTLTINALVELLDERSILPEKDVLERISLLQARTKTMALVLQRIQLKYIKGK